MRQFSWRRLAMGSFLLGGWLACGGSLSANTIVQFNTSLGNVKLRLNDDVAPATVANFLHYVTDGDYADTIIHRSVPGFVIQGGGFTTSIEPVPTDPPVVNEFNLPNVRGTISMAKLGGDPNSATSQWFISLDDNRANLDNQNGGFTVFGHVLEGMDVVEQIAALPTFQYSSPFGEIPLRNFTTNDYNNQVQPGLNNFVVISQAQLAGTWEGPVWHNSSLAQDTTNDGNIFPQDLLALVDRRLRDGYGVLSGPLVGPYYVDVNGNGMFDVDDIDRVLTAINERSSIGTSLGNGGLLASFESSALLTAVPEPASGTLALFFLAAFFRICRRRRIRGATGG